MYLVTNTSMNRIFCDLLKCDRDLRETSRQMIHPIENREDSLPHKILVKSGFCGGPCCTLLSGSTGDSKKSSFL